MRPQLGETGNDVSTERVDNQNRKAMRPQLGETRNEVKGERYENHRRSIYQDHYLNHSDYCL